MGNKKLKYTKIKKWNIMLWCEYILRKLLGTKKYLCFAPLLSKGCIKTLTNPCFFSHLVRLFITSPSGGVWKYPLRFKAKRPVADDNITIESVGLDKESLVSFRINSQSRYVNLIT